MARARPPHCRPPRLIAPSCRTKAALKLARTLLPTAIRPHMLRAVALGAICLTASPTRISRGHSWYTALQVASVCVPGSPMRPTQPLPRCTPIAPQRTMRSVIAPRSPPSWPLLSTSSMRRAWMAMGRVQRRRRVHPTLRASEGRWRDGQLGASAGHPGAQELQSAFMRTACTAMGALSSFGLTTRSPSARSMASMKQRRLQWLVSTPGDYGVQGVLRDGFVHRLQPQHI